MTNDLMKPDGLCNEGERAWEAITTFQKSEGLEDTGGCKAFYSPQEWRDRGEEYGRNAVLIVVHDGGGLAEIFNLDYMRYKLFDRGVRALEAVGLWAEGCTCWYTAIYAH